MELNQVNQQALGGGKRQRAKGQWPLSEVTAHAHSDYLPCAPVSGFWWQ